MSNFTLIEIEGVEGKQKFYKLKKDGICEFDFFCEEIKEKKRYYAELLTIFDKIDYVANLGRLPKTKFRPITPKKETVKEYEFKTKHLRVYTIHEEKTGKIIICGGFKKDQKKDIKHFRSIKKQYLESTKSTKS
ncbi:MAG: hypothetical protein FVQ77_12815 [Cytophagales bacterium]|nr:hypothetical protein [Cytophagales bacterium]